MSEWTEFTVIGTEIIQDLDEDYTVSLIGSSNIRQRPIRTKLKMTVYVEGRIVEYESQIPALTMTTRHATPEEMILVEEMREVDRRHQERMERLRIRPWSTEP